MQENFVFICNEDCIDNVKKYLILLFWSFHVAHMKHFYVNYLKKWKFL